MKIEHIIVPKFKSIILILIGAMLFSCENDLAVVKSLKVDEDTPIESSFDVSVEYTDSGRVTMQMKSPEINRYIGEEEYMEMPQGINMTFYDTSGAVKSTLTSNYAINYTKDKRMEAKNNVIATNAQGQQLFTEQLNWNQKTHKIYTDKKVKVVTSEKILFGDGLQADETFEFWEITNPTGDIEFDEVIETDSVAL